MTLNDEIFFFQARNFIIDSFPSKIQVLCRAFTFRFLWLARRKKNGGMPICRNGKLSNMLNIMEQNKATPSADSYFLCVLIHEWAAVVRVRQEILQLK